MHLVTDTPLPMTPLLVELRASLEAGAVTWALAQADFALHGRPIPKAITELHPDERRKYEDAALVALMGLNRDAFLFAERQASQCAFEHFEQFCKDMGLDWLDDDHPANDGDALEILITRLSDKALQRFRQVLCGKFPGLSQHLAKLHTMRTTEGV